MADIAEEQGWSQASGNLRRYINGGGGTLTIQSEFITKYVHTQVDLEYNLNRFFITEESDTYDYVNVADLASKMGDGEVFHYQDNYSTTIRTTGRDKIFGDNNPSIDQPSFTTELAYALGNFTLYSVTDFEVERDGNLFYVSGKIINEFRDEYNWEDDLGLSVTIFGIEFKDSELAELSEIGAKRFNIMSDKYYAKFKEGSYFKKNASGEYDFNTITIIYE